MIKLLVMEYRILRREMWRIALVALIVPSVLFLIYVNLGQSFEQQEPAQLLQRLFSSAQSDGTSWRYWLLLYAVFIILLQVVWKPRLAMFEVYQLLRSRQIITFWLSKILLGGLFTLFYVVCALSTSVGISYAFKQTPAWEGLSLSIFVTLAINLFGHALLWLAIVLLWRVEGAHIVLMALIYLGSRYVSRFIPMHYGMTANLPANTWIGLVVEALVMGGLLAFILWSANRIDYY